MRLYKNSYTVNGQKQETKNWYIEFYYNQARYRVPAYTNRAVSEALSGHIERLIHCRKSGIQIDPQLSKWLEDISEKLRKLLIRIGLLDMQHATIDRSESQGTAQLDCGII